MFNADTQLFPLATLTKTDQFGKYKDPYVAIKSYLHPGYKMDGKQPFFFSRTPPILSHICTETCIIVRINIEN